MTPAELLRRRIERRVRELSPELRKRAYAALEMVRQALTEAELRAALDNGSVEALITELLSDREMDPAFRSMRGYLDKVTGEAAALEAGNMPATLRVEFNRFSPAVASAVHTMSGKVVDKMKAEIRDTVRQVVADGMAAGKNPRVIAKSLKQTIGLAPNQARNVERFEAQLRAGDRAALSRQLAKNQLKNTAGQTLTRKGHAGGQGLSSKLLGILDRKLGKEALTEAEIKQAVDAYRNRTLAWNVETNARTMALNAQRVGQRTAWQNAIDQGIVDERRLQHTWVTVGDSRVRPEHEEMNGETVPYDQPYSNGEIYPGSLSYNCRCLERYSLAREET